MSYINSKEHAVRKGLRYRHSLLYFSARVSGKALLKLSFSHSAQGHQYLELYR